MSPAATCPWWTRYSSPPSSASVRAIKPGAPQRIVPSSLWLRVFNVLLLLSCSPVGSITAHGAVAGAKVRESEDAQSPVLGRVCCLCCVRNPGGEVIVFWIRRLDFDAENHLGNSSYAERIEYPVVLSLHPHARYCWILMPRRKWTATQEA